MRQQEFDGAAGAAVSSAVGAAPGTATVAGQGRVQPGESSADVGAADAVRVVDAVPGAVPCTAPGTGTTSRCGAGDHRAPGTLTAPPVPDAGDALRDHVTRRYADIRRMAAWIVRGACRQHRLQPTVLVHESYIRMANRPPAADLVHGAFLPLMARVMRQAAIDLARAAERRRRGFGWRRIDERTVTDRRASGPELHAEMREALDRLRQASPRQARIVEMHCIGRMTLPEVAGAEGMGLRTVEKDWARASAYLRQHAGAGAPRRPGLEAPGAGGARGTPWCGPVSAPRLDARGDAPATGGPERSSRALA